MDRYLVVDRIGEGTFGVVLKAKDLESGDTVALKKIRLRNLESGMPPPIFRELKALQTLSHPNIVALYEAIPDGGGITLVFEYMQADLMQTLSHHSHELSESCTKSLIQMMLRGVAHMHSRSIVHRDLKPSNLLISPYGELKLADFGLARAHETERPKSHMVATRWYRAPELLFGSRDYDFAVDIWACGCIIAEMYNAAPIFPGENDIDQLYRVAQVLGTPDEKSYPGITKLPDYNKISFKNMDAVPLERAVPNAPPLAVDLLRQLLVYSPKERITARQALAHPYFFTDPTPCHPSEIPVAFRKGRESRNLAFDSSTRLKFPPSPPATPPFT